ncbi:hypothetical protein [Streptomyces tendae]|uniref:hypothetical protein n=1 Tax=Streptomyces tendae TaxID=1932 RepID=UPI0036A4D49C
MIRRHELTDLEWELLAPLIPRATTGRPRLGRPLAITLTPGQRHDSICARPLLERIHAPRTGVGRPHRRPDQVIADKTATSYEAAVSPASFLLRARSV